MSVIHGRRLLLPALVCAVFAVPASAHASTESSIVHAMNSVRAANHLPVLHTSAGLHRAAAAQSAHVARTHVLSHGSFSRRLRHYTHSRTVGENLAWLSSCDASQVVQLWLHSAAHRAIMLSPSFRRVGVGKRSGSGMCIVTADFASAH
jgi:uncharacterized protein YkwD